VLLLWLGILTLIPFDLASIDSCSCPVGNEEQSLILGIISTAKGFLGDPGPCREAASLCLSSLLTRPDMESVHLEQFLLESEQILSSWQSAGCSIVGPGYLTVLGRVHCLAQLFKQGHRTRLLPLADIALRPCLSISQQSTLPLLLRKSLCKAFQRLATTFLPPALASWRYQRGHRSLQVQLGPSPSVPSSSAPAEPPVSAEEQELGCGEAELEELLGRLVGSLGDADTGEPCCCSGGS